MLKSVSYRYELHRIMSIMYGIIRYLCSDAILQNHILCCQWSGDDGVVLVVTVTVCFYSSLNECLFNGVLLKVCLCTDLTFRFVHHIGATVTWRYTRSVLLEHTFWNNNTQ